MDERILQIVLKARDEASDTLKSTNKIVGNFATSFKEGFTPAAIASGVALAGVAATAMTALGAFNEAEVASKQLEHAVISVTKGTREQLEATSQLADELERKGVLDGDNIRTGLAQLSTFGLTNKQVQGLAGSLADLAVNQFGVNASGEQLTQTANMIAKALNGQFGVLEKSGIRFTEAQQKMIQYGSEMERVKALNEGFAQNLKFTNEVAKQTAEGGLAAFFVQVGNIQESLGQLINAALTPLIPHITEVATALAGIANMIASGEFNALSEDFATLRNELGPVGEAFANAVIFLYQNRDAAIALAGALTGILGAAIIGAFAAMMAFVGITAPVFLVLAAVGAGIALVIAHWGDFVAVFTQARDYIMNTFNTLATGVNNFVQGAINAFNWLKDNWAQALGFIIGFMLTLPIKLPLLMAEAVAGIVAAIAKVNWGAVFKVILDNGIKVFTGIMEAGKKALDYLMHLDWGGLLASIGRGIGNAIIGLIEGAIRGAVSGIPGLDALTRISLPRFDEGGYVSRTGPALVHAGEYVLSRDMLRGRQPIDNGVRVGQPNVNFNGPVYINEGADIDTMGYRLAYILQTGGEY